MPAQVARLLGVLMEPRSGLLVEGGKLRLLVEGWRQIPHSYSIVNAFQLLELLNREDVELFFTDVPFPTEKWRPMAGLFTPEEEERLQELPQWQGETVDAVYRIAFPANLAPPAIPNIPVFVFLTSEYQRFMPDFFSNGSENDIPNLKHLHFITPSAWSHAAFENCGRPCHIVPHGVDAKRFYPMDIREREHARRALGLENKFVWLNISAMTGNKGIDLLLQSFSQICLEEDKSVLFLKGLQDLYNTQHYLDQWLESIDESARARIKSRIFFTEAALPFTEINKLYNVADCYVAPYRAEGFNLPVLEAAACGLPSLVSAGGSTEDFTVASIGKKIETQLVRTPDRVYLAPKVDSLTQQMRAMVADDAFRAQVARAGPKHVAMNYRWSGVVEQLLRIVSSQVTPTA